MLEQVWIMTQEASAMAQAKAAAGDRNVLVHGAYTAQRALEAGVLGARENADHPAAGESRRLAGDSGGRGDDPANGLDQGVACWADERGFGYRQAWQAKRPAGPSGQQ
jgi:hypothetical protein